MRLSRASAIFKDTVFSTEALRLILFPCVALLLLACPATAQTGATSPEARTAAYFDRIADSPPQLRIALQAMPKGSDLHNHAGGSIYAEDFLHWAAADGLCIATDTNHIVAPPCDAPNRKPVRGLERDYDRYSRVIDALSTRGFEAGVGDPNVSGYNRFFATFDAFAAAAVGHVPESIALTKQAAGDDRVAYVELSTAPDPGFELARAVSAAASVDKSGDTGGDTGGDTTGDSLDFARLWRLVEPRLPAAIAKTRTNFDGYEADVAKILGCAGQKPGQACKVEMRYLATAIRTLSPTQVFAQIAYSFALADADRRFVGINIVAPEHDPVAVRDYALHMRMMAYMKARYPKVQMSLHAGELTMGMVPARDLRFHIHDAVEIAGAKRIGHGVDISFEEDATALLARMARDRIAVEINLTSNAVILGVKGRDHPLALYRAAGVPVVLSTDDEGVSRSDMTNEYVRAVTEQKLRYPALKQIVRDSLQYAFLQGPSLWRDRAGGAKVAACTSSGRTSPVCAAFLAASPKAAMQWQLENDLINFELSFG